MKKKYETLKERINSFHISPKDAPPPLTADRFGKWLRAIRGDEEIEQIPAAIVSLVCDIEILKVKARRSNHAMSATVMSYGKSIELQEAIELLAAEPSLMERMIPVQDEIKAAQVDIKGLLASVAVPHDPVNCLPGVFTTKDGKRVFNLDGRFWTGGEGGVVEINGTLYEYPADKGFGNFKKRK